jgi:hypothetical protein
MVVCRAYGDEWAIVGPRAMGMGGAGVAVTRGAMSSYWNPAGLAPPRARRVDTFWDVEVPVTVMGTASNDVFEEFDDVARLVRELNFDDLQTNLDDPLQILASEDLQRVIRLAADEIPDLGKPGTGLLSNASAGVMARIWRFGISGLWIAQAGGATKVDLTTGLSLGDEGLTGAIGDGADRSASLSPSEQAFADSLAGDGLATQNQAEEIAFQASQAGVNVSDPRVQSSLRDVLTATRDNAGGSPGDFLTSNQSGVDIKGIILQEYALSYSQPFFEIFSVGLSAKLLYGWTSYQPFQLSDVESSGDLLKDLADLENREESFNFGLDVGVLVEPLPWLSVGAVGRNLTRPQFDFAGPGDYTVEPQVRAGLGLYPLPGLTLAADVDLCENHSEALPGYDSQVVAGGIEYAIADVLFLRAGASWNFAGPDEEVLLHAGLGLRVWLIQLDVAACATPALTELTTDIDDDDTIDVPEKAGFSLQLGVNIPLD